MYPGTYKECLVIDGTKSLTLQSLEKGNAIIDAEGKSHAIQLGANKPVEGVVIDGFTICNARGENINGICVIDSSDLVVSNNEIRDCDTGIRLVLDEKHSISNVRVESNHFEGDHSGIIWESGSNIVIRNNTFIHYDRGIYIDMYSRTTF